MTAQRLPAWAIEPIDMNGAAAANGANLSRPLDGAMDANSLHLVASK